MTQTKIHAEANDLIAQGVHLIGSWPARALLHPTTTPAGALGQMESSTNDVNDEYIPFVDASTKHMVFSFRCPKSIDEGTTVSFEIEWTDPGTGNGSHVVRWQAEVQGQGDGDTIDSAWGTAVAVDDALGTSLTRRKCTIASVTPAAWAEGDTIFVRIARLGGHANDTLVVDARLIRVTMFATIAAENDA